MVHHQVSNLRRDSHSSSCIEEEVAPGDFGLYSSDTTTQGGGPSQEGHPWHWNRATASGADPRRKGQVARKAMDAFILGRGDKRSILYPPSALRSIL